MMNNAPLHDGDLEIPTAEEIFDRPYPPAPPLPPAWVGDSVAVELADRECARLIVNAMHDPPITEQEIEAYSRRFKIPKRQAEKEIRDRRAARHVS
jgi:alkanesulfonate monooxygenase SsuD/methylene tetrahydromethanopterin reductase-like flavin-dependent oxidoreductase (luciferase family)